MANEIKSPEEQKVEAGKTAKQIKQERAAAMLANGENEMSQVEQGTLSTDDEWEIEAENEATSMAEKYKLFPGLDSERYRVRAKLTKVAGYKGQEDVVLRAKIGSWTKDITLNPRDKEYLIFKGIGKEYEGVIGTYVGRGSGKKYHGIRFDLGNGQVLNYAFTVSKKTDDFRILVEMKYAKEVIA